MNGVDVAGPTVLECPVLDCAVLDCAGRRTRLGEAHRIVMAPSRADAVRVRWGEAPGFGALARCV